MIRLFHSNDPDQFADGEQKRDFIYVKDAVRMTCAFLNNSAGGIFNIGSGIASTWNSLADAIFKAIDKEKVIDYIDMPEDLAGKYQNYTCADMSKTRGVLGNQACATMSLERLCERLCKSPFNSGSKMVGLVNALQCLRAKKVLVAGDFVLDTYTIGKVSRISPEAPVPVLNVVHEEQRPGMVGNVVLNLDLLGADTRVIGRVGCDANGEMLLSSLTDKGIDMSGVLKENTYATAVKNRVIADQQQIVRVDHEELVPLSQDLEEELIASLPQLMEGVDAVAISDYGKGFFDR